MISLILPFWNRPIAAERSINLLIKHYRDLQLEVIVVDDGSPDPFVWPDRTPFLLRTIRLKQKTGPKNPCVPLNAGVAAASGEVIALSSPEILHTRPVLPAMLSQLAELGPKGYVMAACWSREQNRWHAHSSRKRRDDNDVGSMLPADADYHFMSMMHRVLWDEAGGFDEDYRDGAGYDDPDFVKRLERAGARFCMRDDLVVTHVRDGAKCNWTPEMFSRNRSLFLSKWAPA